MAGHDIILFEGTEATKRANVIMNLVFARALARGYQPKGLEPYLVGLRAIDRNLCRLGPDHGYCRGETLPDLLEVFFQHGSIAALPEELRQIAEAFEPRR